MRKIPVSVKGTLLNIVIECTRLWGAAEGV